VKSSAQRATGPLAGAGRAAGLVGVCVTWGARIELAHRLRGEAAARRTFAGAAGRMLAMLGVRVALEGELPDAPEVRVANHTSYLDILALSSIGAGRFLSRHDVATWPLVGRIARQIGTLFVDRESQGARAGALRALVKAAGAGAPLVVFPEGKTSGNGLLPFQRGAFAVARSAGIGVRPLALRYSDTGAAAWVDDMELLPHLWERLCGPELLVTVVALEPFGLEAPSTQELAARASGAIEACLKAAPPPRSPGT
jgi:1-acyl-sn-glycerol-3-phosphate acyltransferase